MIETTSTFGDLELTPEPNRKPIPAAPAATRVFGPAPVFAITSSKGGVGKTDVTANLAAAQEIVVVVTPEPASITDAYALVKVLASAHGQKRFWILAHNVSGAAEALRLFDTLSRAALGFLNVALDYLGWIPRDPRLARAVARSRMVVEDAVDAPSAQVFVAVAQRLMLTAAGGVKVKGNLQFFLRRTLAGERGG